MPSDRRLHPLSVFFGLRAQLRALALPGLFVLITASSKGWGWEVWTMLLLVPYALVSIGRYVSFRYRYEANELVIRTGLLFRNERHVPYARIQNLDAVQNVLHRLLGVAEVRVETGGGQEAEATMTVLPIAAVEEMRRRVFEGRAWAQAPADDAPSSTLSTSSAPAQRTLLRLPWRELMLCGFIENRGVVIVAAALGLLWEFGLGEGLLSNWVFGEQRSGRGVVRAFLGALFGLGGLPVSRIALTVAAFGGLLLLLRLISMGWALVRLHGFRLTRAGEDLRTEFGLLTRVEATIPLHRIQTLTVREGPFHRLFKRASVRVDTAGGHGGESRKTEREWLAPIIRRNEVPRLLHEVLPELDLSAVAWHAADPRAFRRAVKKAALTAVAISLSLVMLLKLWDLALLAVLLVWAYVGARLYVTHLGWAVTDSAVLFRSGWVWRHVSIARFTKIQAVTIHESPFDRRAAMARVRVDTAGAGDASHRVDIPYLPRKTARDLRDVLAAQAARTAFRW